MPPSASCSRARRRPCYPPARRPAPDTPIERQEMTAQIAIVGAGLSGSLTAAVLGRAGYRVTLIDRHPIYPKEFRVEKLAGAQIALLRRLGMLDLLAAGATPFRDILNVRAGRIIDRSDDQH